MSRHGGYSQNYVTAVTSYVYYNEKSSNMDLVNVINHYFLCGKICMDQFKWGFNIWVNAKIVINYSRYS